LPVELAVYPSSGLGRKGSRGKAPSVALVNMPFTSSRSPSIQLGLLQAVLAAHDIPAASLYFNLRLGAALGWETYEVLCNDRTLLLGEWLFSRAAFGDDASDGQSYLAAFEPELTTYLAVLDKKPSYLLDLRERLLPAFIDEVAESSGWAEFDVVGFSSIFEQNVAALALARRLKSRVPELVNVFGGANFEDEMGLEYVRALPWVDYAVIGEGDEVFPAFLDRLSRGADPGALPGVASRLPDGSVRFAGRAPQVANLDALPEPNYREFFATARDLDMPARVQAKTVNIPFETARGCWWGAKHHCTFCGLNGLGMAFRSKSPARVLREVDALAERYALYQLVAVDNILDLRYIQNVFAPLAERHVDYTFFYETKANLTQEQLKQLAKGGVWHLQPGIESLSSEVLKLMNKGTTGIQNVRLLKWGRYYGLNVHWNVLLGFPGERLMHYKHQLDTMRLIPHLQPPESIGRIWLERFSPNYTDQASLGFTNVRPEPAYAHVYPANIDLERVAYFFAYDALDTVPMSAHEETVDYIEDWRRRWESDRPPFLSYQRGAGRLTFTDGRGTGSPRIYRFGELAARIYECCAPTPRGASGVVRWLGEAHGIEADETAVLETLDEFRAFGLVLEEGGFYLSLAVPVNGNW
jgi:ribosomal peptide maturation radical SAM protein 1